MATTATVQVTMPEMGESVTEGTVLEWHVSEGDFVEEGQTIVEVSTDKVDAEVPATTSGVVTQILAQVDEEIAVGAPLCELDTSGVSPEGGGEPKSEPVAEAPSSNGGDATEAAAPAAESNGDEPTQIPAGETADVPEGKAIQITMPEMGESVTEGTVLEWHVAEGESVEEGDTVVEISTDKVDAEVPAPVSGTLTKQSVAVDETVNVGAVLAEMTAGAASSGGDGGPAGGSLASEPSSEAESKDLPATGRDSGAAAPSNGDANATPVARRVAAAEGVDLSSVSGSGPGGKIRKADVLGGN
jgi:pyruvate/2-oxoglutarate dehydrogenase complex dihydrolipoamide acyltransferase (E2) component